MTKLETINKYKEEFKDFVKENNLKWNENNLTLYHCDNVIHSESMEDKFYDGYHNKRTLKLIADDTDFNTIAKFYGEYLFVIRSYTKEDFLNHFANIWEYEFKKTTKGKYKRFDLQFNSELVDTDSIDNYLNLYFDLLDNEDFEEIGDTGIEEYKQMLKETIGANNE